MTGHTNTAKQCRIAATVLLGAAPLAACALFACSTSSGGNDTGFGGEDASTSSSSSSGGGSDASTKGSGKDGSPGVTTPDAAQGSDDGAAATLALPFYLSSQFIPSGFMNDPTGIAMSTGANGGATCPSRAPGAGGLCYVVSWNTTTNAAWAGVYWQYPQNNWGTAPGLVVAPGAKQVSFYAQGAVGGEQLTFKSGGINDPIVASNGSYGDTFEVSGAMVTLSTTWTQYTISLEGATYPAGVLGAFVWTAVAVPDGGANNDITFYIDDLQWQ